MKRWQKVLAGAGVVVVIGLGLVVKFVLFPLPPGDLTKAAVGSKAPDFTLDATSGGKVSLATARPRTTSSRPCRRAERTPFFSRARPCSRAISPSSPRS